MQDQKMLKTKTEISHTIRGQLIFPGEVPEYICQICGEKVMKDIDYDKSRLKAIELYCAKNHKPITDLIELGTYEKLKNSVI